MGTVTRLARYAQVHTDSQMGTGKRPSTPWQMDLAEMLRDEMVQLGISNVRLDDKAYVYGKIPATPGCEAAPAIGFIAHIDTAPDFTGLNVHPRVIENYDGSACFTSGRLMPYTRSAFPLNLSAKTFEVMSLFW